MMNQAVSSPPNTVSASTASLPSGEKFEFWRELSRNAGVEVDCKPIGSDDFDASATGIIQDDLSIFRVETSACRVLRRPDRAETAPVDSLVFYLVNQGRLLVEQGGREVVLEAGGSVACVTNRPFVVECDAHHDVLAIRLPRVLLPRRADLDRFTGHALNLVGGAGTVASAFAQSLAREAATMDRWTLDRMAGIFADLLDATFDVMAGAEPGAKPHRALALGRVKAYIRQHLGDPRLRPGHLPESLNLSQRYLHKLFAAEQTSLARFIWEERLQRAAHTLRSPARDALSISAVALDSGFTNMSHFSRVFRERFGMAPSDYRHAHIHGESPPDTEFAPEDER
jgi:AraC-like DNA-binding protein